MSNFKIISKDSQSIRYEGAPQFNGAYLGVDYIEFRSISSSKIIEWEIGDYVDYFRTGKRYKLYSLPMPKKVARIGSYGAAIEYSNVQFFAATKDLEIAPFKDLVANDNGIHFSTRQDVSTFEDVRGIARRIEACMNDIFPNRWKINVYESDDEDLNSLLSEVKEFSVAQGSCLDALSMIYDTWKGVGWIHTTENGQEVITIGRANVRDAGNTTDMFTYGIGNGLTSIKKAAANDGEFATRLYIYGSERNLQPRYYNGFNIVSKESVDIRNLMIPISDWGLTNGLPDPKKAYLQADDAIIEKYGLIPKTIYFDGREGEEIYPSIVGITEGKVREYMIESGLEDSPLLPPDSNDRIDKALSVMFTDDKGSKEDIEANPNFSFWVRGVGFDIAEQGKKTSEGHATISLKSGMCAGRDFVVKKCRIVGYSQELTIERTWDESLGMGFPNSLYPIEVGDEFVLLDIPMPDYYISIAEDRLLERGKKMLADYTRVSAFYEPGVNSIRMKEVGGVITPGMFMQISDNDIIDTEDHKDYVLIDSISIDENSDIPTYRITLREQKRAARTYSALEDMIEDAKEEANQAIKRERQYTDRRFRSSQETLKMLESAFSNFSKGITPATVKTMALLIGDESLQYKFTASGNSLDDVPCPLVWNPDTKQMIGVPASLIHMTLGVDVIVPNGARNASDYKSWNVVSWWDKDSYDSPFLEDADKSYYIYVRASKESADAWFFIDENAHSMIEDDYYFLVGILNSEYDGSRDFVTLYGFTEVLPGQITTDVIRSADGQTYFDLSKGEIGGTIKFKSNRGVEKSVADLEDEQNNAIAGVQDQIDGVVENWNGEGAPLLTSEPTKSWIEKGDAELIAHINDTYINIEEYVDDERTPTAGHAWRWCRCEDSTITDQVGVTDKEGNRFNLHWHPIADSDAVRALKEASEAKSLAESNIQRLNALYDDGLITQAEKFEFFQEEAFVHTDKAEIDNQVQKYGLTENKMYISYLSAYNNYEAAIVAINTATDDQFPLSVAELGLVWKTNAYYGTRNNVLQEIANAVKNAIDAAQSSANKAISDTEHLVNAFAKGETNISGGVVMTQMVAVGDGGENIDAFLNGSDFAEDDTHGKLLLAAGIPDGTTALEERAKEAATRVYEDGTLKTVKGEFEGNIKANGGEIGRLKITVNPQTKATTLSSGTDYCSKGFMESASLTDGNFGASTSYNDKEGVCNQPYNSTIDGVGLHCRKQYKQDSLETFLDDENWKRGSADIFIEHGDSFDGSETAFRVNSGLFKGLRPSIYIADSDVLLSAYDYTIIVETSGITLYLPENPKVGQRYEIFKPYSNAVNIDPQGVQVYSSGRYNGNNGKGTNVTKLGTGGFARAVYIYTGTYWFRTIENYD